MLNTCSQPGGIIDLLLKLSRDIPFQITPWSSAPKLLAVFPAVQSMVAISSRCPRSIHCFSLQRSANLTVLSRGDKQRSFILFLPLPLCSSVPAYDIGHFLSPPPSRPVVPQIQRVSSQPRAPHPSVIHKEPCVFTPCGIGLIAASSSSS